MRLPDTLTEAQSNAVIECLKILAQLGADEIDGEPKTEPPSNLAGAGDSVTDHNGATLSPKVNTDV